jgi:enoyl-CoA hydratase
MEQWRFDEGINMTYKNLIYKVVEKVGIIKVNRPEVRNVLNWETWMEFEDAMKRLHSDPNLRVGVITGVGNEAWALQRPLKENK